MGEGGDGISFLADDVPSRSTAARLRQEPKLHPSVLQRPPWSPEAYWRLCRAGSDEREASSYPAECGGSVALIHHKD